MSGLAHLAWRSLAERRGRAALTLVGLVLGIALFTSALVTLASASTMIERVSQDAMGSADVVASGVGAGTSALSGFVISTFPADVEHRLAAVDGVEATAALLSFPSSVATADGEATTIRVNAPPPVVIAGVDIDEAVPVFGLALTAGRFAAEGRDEVVVSDRLAGRLGIVVGEAVTIDTPTGARIVTVTGTSAPTGVGRISSLAFADLAVAQSWAGRPGEVSQLGIQLQSGVDPAEWIEQARPAAGPAVDLQSLDDLLAFLDAFVGTFTEALTALSAAVVFLGGFLLYLTMATAVIERTRLYGLLAALGATRRQVRRLVLGESVLLGVVAAAAGLPTGIGLAVLVRRASTRLIEQIGAGEGLRTALVIPWWALAAGAVVALIATAVAGAIPARRAATVDPVEAIRTGSVSEPPTTRWTAAVGAGLVLTGGALLVLSSSMTALGVGMVAVLLGSIFLTPYLLRPLAAVLGRMTARLSPGTGDVAVHHLTSHRTRSAYTLALVMLVMALTIATGATHVSFVTSLDRQVDREFGDDLRVEAASTLDDDFLARLAALPGVDGLTTISFGNGVALDGEREVAVNIESIDPASYFDIGSFVWIDGNDADARNALASGGAAIVPAGLASSLGTERGDTITMRTNEGVTSLEVAGTVEVTNIPPTIAMSASDAARYFGVRGTQVAQLNLAPGIAPEDMRATIIRELGGTATFIVSTAPELKADARAQVAGALDAVFALLALAAVVGVLGLGNTMAMSVLQRTREIGILRAIGARARHLRLMILAESLTLVTVAFVLSIPIGLALSGPLLAGVRRGLGDTTVPYAFPWAVFPVVAVAGLVAAAVASLLPAQRAVRLDIDTTLRDE